MLQKNKAKVLKNLGGKMLFMIGSFGKHLSKRFQINQKVMKKHVLHSYSRSFELIFLLCS